MVAMAAEEGVAVIPLEKGKAEIVEVAALVVLD